MKTTLGHVEEPLGTVPTLGLCGGVALYLLAHVALRLRMGGGWRRGRPIAALILLAMLGFAGQVPALLALSLVTLICALLITYEALAHRESRAFIRERRGAFSTEEALEIQMREKTLARRPTRDSRLSRGQD